MTTSYDAADVRAGLDAMGARGLVAALGLRGLRGAGAHWRGPCPIHNGKNPQAFVLSEGDAGLVFVCHTGGCGGGDALALVGVLHGLDPKRDFPELLRVGAEIAGVAPADPGATRAPRRAWTPPEPTPPTYPDRGDVLALLDAGRTMRDGKAGRLPDDVSGWLSGRGIDGEHAYRCGLVVPLDGEPDLPHALGARPRPVPGWASRWFGRGYRALFRLYDAGGMVRSLRARRVGDGDGPKSLAPRGFNVRGLVLATLGAVRWLRGYDVLRELVIVEGETDLLSAAQAWPSCATVGLVSGGSWTADMAAKVPEAARVLVATDNDQAGDKYAETIGGTLGGRCEIRRVAAWT